MIMRPFGILLAACLIVLPIVTQRASAEPELKVNDLIESGKTAFKAGNYRVCEQIFQKTLSLCKRNSLIAKEISAYRWLIWTYTDQHKFAKAEELCSKEIEYITRLNKARHYLVEVLSIRGLLECDENKLLFRTLEKATGTRSCCEPDVCMHIRSHGDELNQKMQTFSLHNPER